MLGGMRSRACSPAPGPAALAVLLCGCAGMFSTAPSKGADEVAPSVQALRVAVAPEVAIVADGDVGADFKSRLRGAVEMALGQNGLTVVTGDAARDVVVRIEARVRGAVYFLHGTLNLKAEHDGVVVGLVSAGPDLHKEVDFPERMSTRAVRVLVRTDSLVEFAQKKNPGLIGRTLLASTRAPPAPPPETGPGPDVVAAAKQHAKQGTTFYNLDRHAEALAEYEAAYLAVPDAALLFNIAQCHRKLGHDKEALAFYKTYLRNAPRAPNRADVEKRIQELEGGRVATTPRAR
jgi:hypothetical protein